MGDELMAKLLEISVKNATELARVGEAVDNHVKNTDKNFEDLNEKLDKNQIILEKSIEKVESVDTRVAALEAKINQPNLFQKIGSGVVYVWSIKPVRQAAYLISLPLFMAFSAHFGLPSAVVSVFAAIFGM
jgi:hypothetical protein